MTDQTSDTSGTVDTGVVPPAAWYGEDAEVKGYLENRALHDKPVNEVALAVIKAHREAEKFIGVPPAQLVRLPTDAADAEGWKAVYTRLGSPEDAAAYDFSGLKAADDKEPPAALLDLARQTAASLHLSKDNALALAKNFVQFQDAQAAARVTETTAAIETAKAALKDNWGANFEGNLLVARNAAQALGIAPEAVAALESVIGYDKVMETLRNIGTKIGEDKFITNNNPSLPNVRTREQAVDEKAGLMADPAFVKRFLDGDREAGRQMTALDTLISSNTDFDRR